MIALEKLIRADVGIIQFVSYEIQRVHGLVNEAAKSLNRKWFTWDCVRGLRQWTRNNQLQEKDSEMAAIEFIMNWFHSEEAMDSILILEDIHAFYDEVRTIRRLRDVAQRKYRDRTLILSQPTISLPKDLEKEIHILELPLPERAQLEDIYNLVCSKYQLSQQAADDTLLQSALGLTIMEAEKAFSQAVAEDGKLGKAQAGIVIREKEQIIKKSGFLEYYHPMVGLSDIGGLENLKDWLKKRGRGFDDSAADFGLDAPRGVLLLGIPGTGKSLAAKAIGSEWNFPLLRLDMGRIFGGIVGESEKNIRQALSVAEALAPSILWIDEIEKGLSGIQSSGSTDGGTTSRVLGTFLTWMQEKKKPVFVVATANNISQLPPELLRKGRFDEIFFVDLPSARARVDILKIHLRRKNRERYFNNQELEELAKYSTGYSGAEIEEAIKEALFNAYDRGEDIKISDIAKALSETCPLSQIMRETISDMRNWAKARAKLAAAESVEEEETKVKANDNVPRLQHEAFNPFIK